MPKQKRLKPYGSFYDDVKELYGRDAAVYGPYIRNSDGRAIAQVVVNGKTTTKLYAKFKLEIKLGRKLTKHETVDHIDDNPFNDKFSNLRLLSRTQNVSRAVLRRKIHPCKCLWCGTEFTPTRSQTVSRSNLEHAGPFCSKHCTGRYGKSVQDGGRTFGRTSIKKTYYRIDEINHD